MKKILTLLVAVMTGITASAQLKAPQIIAHRGFHASEGAARNSLNARSKFLVVNTLFTSTVNITKDKPNRKQRAESAAYT